MISKAVEWFHRKPMRGDAVLTVLFLPITIVTTMAYAHDDFLPFFGWGLLFTVPLLWRRSRPHLAMTGIVFALLIQLFIVNMIIPADIVLLLMIHTVVAYKDPKEHRWWLIGAFIGCFIAGYRWEWDADPTYSHLLSTGERIARGAVTVVICGVGVIAAWFSGLWVRARNKSLETEKELAIAAQEQRARDVELAAEEERSRIAREMHDIVAHSLSVIVVQSDGAAYLASRADVSSPEARLAQVAKAIETIQTTARGALAETRRLVGILRNDDEPIELAPTATLDHIEELVTQLAVAGVAAHYYRSGDPQAHPLLSAGAQAAAYRIVQESLTNVIKHAGPGARVDVTVHHDATGLYLRIADTGKGLTHDDQKGHGIIGMRERMVAWGGTLTARSREGGGFEVLAHLPASDQKGNS